MCSSPPISRCDASVAVNAAMTAATITEDDFLLFREFFYRKTGINFELSKRYFVDKRLLDRIDATNTGNFEGYFRKLRGEYHGEELQHLTNVMTVNETYFLREEYQFECLVYSILPEITERRAHNGPLRVWCLPSSSGEEPYTIAMYLLEYWASGLRNWDLEIVASDIDTGMIKKAQAGRYSQRSIQYLPQSWLKKYFTRVGDEYQICDDLRQSVSFTRVNLSSVAEMNRYRDFDVIFCRNLLIYFDDISRKRAAEALYESLTPGGYLCLGHSESMSRISSLFRVRKFPEAMVYQKSPGAL